MFQFAPLIRYRLSPEALRRENEAKALLTRYAANRAAAVLVAAAGRTGVRTIEAQVVGEVAIARRRGPVEAVAALVGQTVPIIPDKTAILKVRYWRGS